MLNRTRLVQRAHAWAPRPRAVHAPPLPTAHHSCGRPATCGLQRSACQLAQQPVLWGRKATAVAAGHLHRPALVIPHAPGLLRPLAACILLGSPGEARYQP